MKKSEAIKQWRDWANNEFELPKNLNDETAQNFILDKTLDFLTERIGMLPPKTCETGNCTENGCGHFWE